MQTALQFERKILILRKIIKTQGCFVVDEEENYFLIDSILSTGGDLLTYLSIINNHSIYHICLLFKNLF